MPLKTSSYYISRPTAVVGLNWKLWTILTVLPVYWLSILKMTHLQSAMQSPSASSKYKLYFYRFCQFISGHRIVQLSSGVPFLPYGNSTMVTLPLYDSPPNRPDKDHGLSIFFMGNQFFLNCSARFSQINTILGKFFQVWQNRFFPLLFQETPSGFTKVIIMNTYLSFRIALFP